MKKAQFYILITFLLNAVTVFSQQDSITQLEEVVLSDVRLHKNSRGQAVTVLGDSTIIENDPLLGSLLQFNSPIFFRQNGYGMVSSASFRGTTASQTAVVWNGININSQFTGQTDFNSINTSGYNNIAVRAGGGSVLYGSGAIGGSVHLNNDFNFNGNFNNVLRLEYGSFNTRAARYSGELSTDKQSIYLNIGGLASDNDFEYLENNRFNENGDFQNVSLSAGFAHWLDERNILKFYTDYYLGERGFSGTLTAPSQSKYEDVNSRNLVEWKGLYLEFTSSLKLAYLDEKYKYFENRNREDFSFGNAKNYIANYDLNYRLSHSINLSGIVDFRKTDGQGSNVGENSRTTTAFSFLLNHELGRIYYELSARKEITESYESPVLYSLSTGYTVTPGYNIHLNFSKNFRIPTFNDLFWRAGGTLELKPETSYQGEIVQKLQLGNLRLNFVTYLMEIDNLLRWIPDAGGTWRPVNTARVQNYGLELNGKYSRSFNAHQLSINGGYSFTKTKDKRLDKELIYVPNHKATGSFGYSFERISVFYRVLYNGRIYTSSDNNYELAGYALSNVGIGHSFFKNNLMKAGLEVRNLYNKYYQSLPSRPMPGRSIYCSLTFKF